MFSFKCKYDTIEDFLNDTEYSNFIMSQPWFSGIKHRELRENIQAYKMKNYGPPIVSKPTQYETIEFSFNCKYDTIEAFLADKKYSKFIMSQSWFSLDKHKDLRDKIAMFKSKEKQEYEESEKLRRRATQLYAQYEPEHYEYYLHDDGFDARFRMKEMRERFIALAKQEKYFKECVSEELIATAMHPCRIQAQMEKFDDNESYFEAMGW
jgi:hypothetical protein